MDDKRRTVGARLRQAWKALPTRPLHGIAIAVVGFVLVAVVFAYGQEPAPEPATPGELELSDWGAILLILGIALCAGGLIALAEWDSRRKLLRGDRRAQIEGLTKSLQDALKAIEVISTEIESGQRVLEKLETDLAARRHAAQLSAEETAAVEHVVQSALRKESRRSLYRDVLMVGLGVFLGWVVQNGMPT